MGTLKVNNIQSTIDGSVSFPQGLSSSNQPISIPDGTVSSPSIRFDSDPDTGIYRIDANTIGISTNGSEKARIDNNGLEVIDGTVSNPSISFINDPDTGLYRIGANTIGIASNGTERLRIDGSGNIGIGTTSIGGSSTNRILTLSGSDSSVVFCNTTGVQGNYGVTSAGWGLLGTITNHPLVFNTNNVERMRLSNGNLEIKANSGGLTHLFTFNEGGGEINLCNSVGSQGLLLDTLSTNNISTSSRVIHVANVGDLQIGIGGTNTTGSISFHRTNGFIESMRLDVNGYLLIGYGSSNGAFRLQVNSQIFATSSTIATSDGRYKENIQPLTGALDLIVSLNPVQFDWKKHPIHNFDTETPTVGFIAQEVEQVLADKPYLNSIIKRNQCIIEPEEKDDEGNVTKEAVVEEFLGIAEGNMIAILTKAIQELKEEVNNLKLQIA